MAIARCDTEPARTSPTSGVLDPRYKPTKNMTALDSEDSVFRRFVIPK